MIRCGCSLTQTPVISQACLDDRRVDLYLSRDVNLFDRMHWERRLVYYVSLSRVWLSFHPRYFSVAHIPSLLLGRFPPVDLRAWGTRGAYWFTGSAGS